MDINCLVNITKTYGTDMTIKIGCVQHDCDECKARLAQPAKSLLLSAQQIHDMCAKFGWDDSYQSLKAYRTVEAMSLELNQLEK